MGQLYLVSSLSADTSNYTYTSIIVNGAGPYNVTFNGVPLTLAGPQTISANVMSVESGNSNVLLSGYLTTYDFPVYLGNSWSTDYQGRNIINSAGGGVWAQSGNTQYAYYK
jgi:hypothetical protein